MEVLVNPPDVMIAASPEQVWDVLADFGRHAEWSPSFRLRGASARRGAPVLVISRLLPVLPAVVPALLVRSERGRVLAWGGRIPGLMRLEHAFELSGEGRGTRVRHFERFTGPGALAVRPLQARFDAQYALISERLRARAEALAA